MNKQEERVLFANAISKRIAFFLTFLSERFTTVLNCVSNARAISFGAEILRHAIICGP